MTIEEQERRVLQEALVNTLGPRPADTLMHYLPPVGWADVATKHDLDALEEKIGLRIDSLRMEVNAGLAGVHAKIDTQRADVDTKIDTGLADVHTKIDTGLASVHTRIDTGLAGLHTKIDTGLADVHTKIDTGLADVRIEIAGVRTELYRSMTQQTWRIIGSFVAAQGLLFTALKLF